MTANGGLRQVILCFIPLAFIHDTHSHSLTQLILQNTLSQPTTTTTTTGTVSPIRGLAPNPAMGYCLRQSKGCSYLPRDLQQAQVPECSLPTYE